jgi:hypothetical protein
VQIDIERTGVLIFSARVEVHTHGMEVSGFCDPIGASAGMHGVERVPEAVRNISILYTR